MGSRRVSFSARGSVEEFLAAQAASNGFVAQLQAALAKCLAGMPCVPRPIGERKGSLPKDADLPLPVKAAAADAPGEAGAVTLSPSVLEKVTALFKKLDDNGDGTVTKAEAQAYWKANWAKVNATAMFNEVDDDGNGEVTFPEWLDFWRNVLAQPDYTEEEVEEELDNMLEGGSWVDWNDGRTT